MSAFCGVVVWEASDATAEQMLRGVEDTLAPYGEARSVRPSGPFHAARLTAFGQASVADRPDAGASAVVVGRLVRTPELRQHLGDSIDAMSDAEVLVLAHRRWERAAPEHLHGAYAGVVVDHHRGEVFAVRDHVGSRFLAYHRDDGHVAFSTTALSLTGLPGVGHELDRAKVLEIAVTGYGSERTLVRGVSSIGPGSAMRLGRHGTDRWRWWTTCAAPIDDRGSLVAHAEALRAELERSVRDAVRDGEQPGVLLSGGLDSSSVAAVLAASGRFDRIPTYTSVPPRSWSGPVPYMRVADERFAVEALARRHARLVPRFIDTKAQDLFEHSETIWELGGGPDRNPLNMLWEYRGILDAAADGVDALLTGGLGNAGFSADGPLWVAELLARGRLIGAWREIDAWSEQHPRGRLRNLWGFGLYPLIPAGVRSRRATRRRVDLLSEAIDASAIRPDRLPEVDVARILATAARPHPQGWTRDLARVFQDPAGQAETDAAYAALYGVELRDPTADRRLLEHAVTQPEWWRRHQGITRAACRAAMADLLPPEIVDRQSIGFQLADWFDRLTDAREVLRGEVSAMKDHPATRDAIDVERLERLMHAWPDRSRMADQDVQRDYLNAFIRAVYLSRYLRWFEGRARRIARGGPAVVVNRPDL
ncbi:MAG: asparagine synthase-related protein [Actinomycetes bacterium]